MVKLYGEKSSVLILQILNCGLEFRKNVFVDSDKFLCSREKYRTRQIFMWCNVSICLTFENNWLKYLLIIFPLKILSFEIQLWEMKVFRICNRNASFTNLFYDTHADNLIVGRNFMTRHCVFEKNWISMELRRSCLVYQNENLTFDSDKRNHAAIEMYTYRQTK